jgi:hypothetical protein
MPDLDFKDSHESTPQVKNNHLDSARVHENLFHQGMRLGEALDHLLVNLHGVATLVRNIVLFAGLNQNLSDGRMVRHIHLGKH